MIAAIMQPYFFPYIGYFQLMGAVDAFVFLDDAQYINRGWVNRNLIPIAGEPAWLTMPVVKASRACAINQRVYLLEEGVGAILDRMRAAYGRRASEAAEARFISELLAFPRANVAAFNMHLLSEIARRLGVGCALVEASQIPNPGNLRGQARIIAICRHLGASHYINPIGGVELYGAEDFRAAGMNLAFLRTTTRPEPSSDGALHFSIIDGLIRDGVDACRARLGEYELQVAA
jgi:hypothetical protein